MCDSIIDLGARELKPHVLAIYARELADAFNQFYRFVPVIAAEDEKIRAARLALVDCADWAMTIVTTGIWAGRPAAEPGEVDDPAEPTFEDLAARVDELRDRVRHSEEQACRKCAKSHGNILFAGERHVLSQSIAYSPILILTIGQSLVSAARQ